MSDTLEWEQVGTEKAAEWDVKAVVDVIGEGNPRERDAVFMRARAWFCGFRQRSVAELNETNVARFRLLPMSDQDDNSDAPSAA